VVLDPGSDALGRLANSLGRPRASLAAFSSLSEQQLTLLTEAIEATAQRRHAEVDAALFRAFPDAAATVLAGALRRRGRWSPRDALLDRHS